MRPGRLPENHPEEQEARRRLRGLSAQAIAAAERDREQRAAQPPGQRRPQPPPQPRARW